jgi:phosphoglycolate phosphatase
MKRLFLFDIDGTLVKARSNDRFAQTINNLHGLEVKIKHDYHGSTDRIIFIELLKGVNWSQREIMKAMPELMEELDRIHRASFSPENVKILPGIVDLLSELKKQGQAIGLITGNIEVIAKRKLEAVGIYSYFPLGGFGSDPHTERADLVKIAVDRAEFSDDLQNVYVIGDTPRDIWAAHEAGIINSVGVSNGFRSSKELVDAGAKIVFDDFKDTKKVLAEFGL